MVFPLLPNNIKNYVYLKKGIKTCYPGCHLPPPQPPSHATLTSHPHKPPSHATLCYDTPLTGTQLKEFRCGSQVQFLESALMRMKGPWPPGRVANVTAAPCVAVWLALRQSSMTGHVVGITTIFHEWPCGGHYHNPPKWPCGGHYDSPP